MANNFVTLHPIKIKKTDLFYLFIFSGAYIKQLPIAPPYIVSLFLAIYYGYISCINKKVLKVTFVSFLLLFCFLCLFALKGNILSFISHFSSLLMFPFIVELGKNLEKQVIINHSISFIQFSILFLIVECISRYISGALWPMVSGFGRFKEFSMMFVDSNLTAEFILVLYFFCKYLKIYHNISTHKYQVTLLVFCILTLSRAAIASLVLSLVFSSKIKKHDDFFRIFIFRSIVVSLILFVIYKLFFDVLYETDGSFYSKFYFFERAQALFVFSWNKVLTGTGLGTAVDFLQGRYPHNFFLLYFIEIGIIGILIKIIYMIVILASTKMKGLLLIVPYFIAEQSVASYGVHYVYVVLAIITLLETNRNYERNNNHRTSL